MAQNPAKTQVVYATGRRELNFVQYYCQKDKWGRFCAYVIANWAKNNGSELGEDVVHLPKLHVKMITSHVQLC